MVSLMPVLSGNLDTGETEDLLGSEHSMDSVAWHPDGRLLAIAVEALYPSGPEVRIYDAQAHEVVQVIEMPEVVNKVEWNPDGTLLAAGSEDGTTTIWETATWQVVRVIGDEEHNAAFRPAWSPDGSMIAAQGGTPTIGVWDAAAGDYLTTFTDGAGDGFYDVFWCPQGRYLAGFNTHTIQVWDVVSEALVSETTVQEYLYHMAWSPDCRTIIYGGAGIFEPVCLECVGTE